MTPAVFLQAQNLALELVESAVKESADYNVTFNAFGIAVVGLLVSYMEDHGIELTEENIKTQLQKFHDNTVSAGTFIIQQRSSKEQNGTPQS